MEASSSMTVPARNPRDVVAAVSPVFEGLFRAEYARVVGIAHRVLADQAEAEDVAQEVFLQVFRYLSRFQGRAELKTWVYKICSSQASRLRRRMRALECKPTVRDPWSRGSLPGCR